MHGHLQLWTPPTTTAGHTAREQAAISASVSASFSALVAVLVAVLIGGGAARADAGTCWEPPVVGVVVDPFRDPPCRWCAGNRGLDYRTRAGSAVRAVATGTVVFAGIVVDTRYVVVRDAAGRRVTYGRLASIAVQQGDVVLRGARVGATGERFHLGVRVDDRYVDPAPLIGRLEGRPRLVPTDGTTQRPAPAPRLRCAR